MRIPRVLNFIWVGNEKECPHVVIDTWRLNHPHWEIKIWGNDSYHFREWKLKNLMDEMWESGQLCGVADLMRWEILYEYGGYTVDADMVSLATLPSWLSGFSFFASYENEAARRGLISNGIVGCEVGSRDARNIMHYLLKKKHVAHRYNFMSWKYKKNKAWKVTGPGLLTKVISSSRTAAILPSHFFLPIHHTGLCSTKSGPFYTHQLWGSTNNIYESMGRGVSSYALIQESKNKVKSLMADAKRVT